MTSTLFVLFQDKLMALFDKEALVYGRLFFQRITAVIVLCFASLRCVHLCVVSLICIH